MTSSTGRASTRPTLPRGPLLGFLLASSAVLICQGAQAQATASGGQTVEIAPGQATCSGKDCFQSFDAGSLLHNNAGTPIDVTTPNSWPTEGPFYFGAMAWNGGTIHLDGGGTFHLGTDTWGLWAGHPFKEVTPGTITGHDLTFDMDAGAFGIGVNYNSTITLDGTTTMTARGGGGYGIEARLGTVTLNGPIKASGVWLDFAHADAGDIYFNGGGTVTATGSTYRVFSSGGGLISMRGVTASANTNVSHDSDGTDFLASVWDNSRFFVIDSTFEGTNTGGPINGIHVTGNGGSSSFMLDNSQITLKSAGSGILVEGASANVTLTHGSAITPVASSKGGLLARIAAVDFVPTNSFDIGKLTLRAQDSALSGDVQVDAPGKAGANEFDGRLEGTTLWRGNLTVAKGSLGSVTLADRSRWIGTANNATSIQLSDPGTLWAIPGGSAATVTGTVTNAGRIAFRPGTPSTLTVGTFVNNGGTVQVNVDAAGHSDFIHATGTATVNGGTVYVVPVEGTYEIGRHYKILTANGGITGQFDKVTDNAPFVDFSLSKNVNNIYVNVARNGASFASLAALDTNQRAVAQSVEALALGNKLYDAVALSPDDTSARQAFSTLSGDVHASARSALIQDSGLIRDAVLNRLANADTPALAPAPPVAGLTSYAETPSMKGPSPFDAAAAPAPLSGFWAQGFGSWGHLGGGGRNARIDHDTGGFLIGFDTLVQGSFLQDWRLGALAGYSHSTFDVDARSASGKADNYHIGLYAGRRWNALALRLGATYTWHDIDSDRTVAVPGYVNRLTTSYDAATAQLFGELGYRIDAGAFRLEPFANAAYLNLHTDGFRETGGDAALAGGSSSTDLGFTTLGTKVATSFDLTEGTIATLQASLGWRHAYGDVKPTAVLALANGTVFTSAGIPIARDALVVDAGVSVAFSEAVSLGVSYNGQFGNKAADQSVRGNFVWRF
ncbi:autotransporter family protein [Labrys neptuniae]